LSSARARFKECYSLSSVIQRGFSILTNDLVNFLLNFVLNFWIKDYEENGPCQSRRCGFGSGREQVHASHPQLLLWNRLIMTWSKGYLRTATPILRSHLCFYRSSANLCGVIWIFWSIGRVSILLLDLFIFVFIIWLTEHLILKTKPYRTTSQNFS